MAVRTKQKASSRKAKATSKRKTKTTRKTSAASTRKTKASRKKARRGAVRSLGRELLDTLEAILDLREATSDPDRSRELRKLQKELSSAASALIEANLEANTERYREAREGLVAAAADVRDATKGLTAVVTAITGVGKAIKLLERLAKLG